MLSALYSWFILYFGMVAIGNVHAAVERLIEGIKRNRRERAGTAEREVKSKKRRQREREREFTMPGSM